MRRLVNIAAVGFVVSTACIFAQGGGPAPGMRGPGGGPLGHFGPGFGGRFGKVVTGAPYSADVSDQSIQTLSDGNTVQHSTTGHIARDSQGRTYSQETITGGPFGQQGPVVVTFINDPVAGYSYVLNANTKVATRRAIPKPPSGTPSADFPGRGQRGPRDSANLTTSDLGTQTISGVTAQGKSVTHTIPAGSIGNAQPIVSTSETWYSPDLQVILLAKRSDPRMGQSTYSLTNIQRAEPAASLFQVPSDYTMQDAPAGPGGRFRGPGRQQQQ
ncbi:MAG: hypothetical protein ACJ746_15175 [Bryobacteraceae bacterium]